MNGATGAGKKDAAPWTQSKDAVWWWGEEIANVPRVVVSTDVAHPQTVCAWSLRIRIVRFHGDASIRGDVVR